MANRMKFQSPTVIRPQGGGTQPGLARRREVAMEIAHRYGILPFEILCLMVMGEFPCQSCGESGRVTQECKHTLIGVAMPARYFELGLADQETDCPHCLGTGKVKFSPKDQAVIALELAQYIHPKLKAVEIDVADKDKPIQVVRFGSDKQVQRQIEAAPVDRRARLRTLLQDVNMAEHSDSRVDD